MLAIWFQETDAISSGNAKLLMIFIGLVAIAIVAVAIVLIVVALKAVKAITSISSVVDELKGKALPLIETATRIGNSSHAILEDVTPKVKIITDHLVETSRIVKASAQQCETTLTDANMRTQRQVSRVDEMVSAALATTAEVVETVNHGIRVPAQKIAVIANQLRYAFEGMLAKVKSMTGRKPFTAP